MVHSNIFNLSKTFLLTETERKLLEKGLTFIPTPGEPDPGDLRRDIHAFNRKLKVLDYLNFENNILKAFTGVSTWEPPILSCNKHNQKFI